MNKKISWFSSVALKWHDVTNPELVELREAKDHRAAMVLAQYSVESTDQAFAEEAHAALVQALGLKWARLYLQHHRSRWC